MIQQDLTEGNITSKLWLFALPLMVGNVLQQFYNLVDTWIVGKYIGSDALAAVGTAYSFMTFLISIIIGLCLGSSSFISMAMGQRDENKIRNGIFISFLFTAVIALLLSGICLVGLHPIMNWLQVPEGIQDDMYTYLYYIILGLFGTFLYNYFANLLRGIGNSFVPLIFLGISVGLNVALDFLFVVTFHEGIRGAAIATMIAQYISGIGLMICYHMMYQKYRIRKQDLIWRKDSIVQIVSLSGYTCMQQSVMNLGILMVQGIVNSFGTTVMAAFAVAVKIDTIAYMPVQDFGNAFSFFVAQNYGAQKTNRIREGIHKSAKSVVGFCLCISALVFLLAPYLLGIFISVDQSEIISIGVQYLRVEGVCYTGIGILFLLYGYYRGVNRPKMSLLLTIISLGTRVLLATILSKVEGIGVVGIWVAIPIGWALADSFGIWYMRDMIIRKKERI